MTVPETPRRPRVMRKRTIAYVLAMIAEYRAQHHQRYPTLHAPFPRPGDSWNAIDSALIKGTIAPDSWKAVCKALRQGSVQSGADKQQFYAWVGQAGCTPSLHTFKQCYRDELEREYALMRVVI